MEPMTAGYFYDKEHDGAVDPLEELLDAYQGFVRRKMSDLANATMEAIHEFQNLVIGKGYHDEMEDKGYGYKEDYDKGHSMGYSNPVQCLSMAHLALLAMPEGKDLAAKVRGIIDMAANAMFSSNEDDPSNRGMGNNDMVRPVRRVVRQEGEQFCVYSETGRLFGCYSNQSSAIERLEQIESFSAKAAGETVKSLIEWHDNAHRVDRVTPAIKTVHDIISDILEVEHGLSEPYALDTATKMAMLSDLETGFVSKAAEYRYTLGPAYVPDREDAHGEFADSTTLQAAMWDWVRKGDRTIYLQHSEKAAGEMVEMMTMPFPIEAELTVPNQGVTKYTFPADTPFLGVVWEPWAWDMVKAGELRGYSIGGTAKRVEADLPVEATV